MEAIFHEKQEGSLCAQHCLNALLQGPYFTPVDLATLAQRMDNEERLRMLESGDDSEEYRRFLQQPSGNYDDSGYFSVQVISSALEVWGLELVPYNSTEERAVQAHRCPTEMNAFICNYRDHWFTIRRLGRQWFNLNSLLSGPELISDTYLTMFLAQLQQEGYSIFVVFGDLPESEADNLLRLVPAVQLEKPRLLTTAGMQRNVPSSSQEQATVISASAEPKPVVRNIPIQLEHEQVKEPQRTPNASLQNAASSTHTNRVTADDEEAEQLQRALELSLSAVPRTDSQDEELQLQQALSLSLDEDALQLERALRLSLECCDPSSEEINPEEIRRRRLAYLESAGNRPVSGSSNKSSLDT